jgi:hypothetical protein
VRDHSELSAPNCPSDEVVMVTYRPFREPIDAAGDAVPVASLGVVALGRVGVSEVQGLGC